MSDLLQKIDEVTTRVAALQKERSEREKSANAHEQAAREDRLAMTAIKQELAQLDAVLRHSQVAVRVQSAEQAAAAAQVSAEETLQRLTEKEKALDALIAKAKE